MHYTTSCNTQSSGPEDGQNNFPKHVELTGIINKPLSFPLVACLYYLYFIIFLRLAKQSQLNENISLLFVSVRVKVRVNVNVNVSGRLEVTERRGRRRKKLLVDLKEKRE